MWNFAFSAFLPSPLYMAALWLQVYAVVALLRQPQTAGAGVGLGLVALAGFKLDYTYFNLPAGISVVGIHGG